MLSDDPCVRVWRDRLGSSYRVAYRVFRRFFDEVLAGHPTFGDMSPKELVEWQRGAQGVDAYKIRMLAQKWINGRSLRYSTKLTYLNRLSSFWLHNLAPWPDDASFHFTSDKPPVEGRLNFEVFQRIVLNSNKLYRPVFLMMGQAFLSISELVYVSNHKWREVLDHLTKNDGFFKVTLPGRKRNRNKKNYYIILSTKSDWASAMQEYLRSTRHSVLGCLFRTSRGTPLKAFNIESYFHNRSVETGVIKLYSPKCSRCQGETVKFRKWMETERRTGYRCLSCNHIDWASEQTQSEMLSARYGVNPHEIRDLMRSRWQVSQADPLVAEFMMGHNIDPNNYNKFMKYEPWYPIQEYRKALPWLNVLSEDPEKVSRSSVDVELEEHRRRSQKLNQELLLLKRWKDDVQKDLDMLKRKIKKKNR